MALYHMAKGPVNYTVVGSPTINNGVVSGFSVDDYIQLNNSQVSNVYSFESCIKIKFSSENLRGWFYHFGCFALSKYDRGNLEFLYRNEGDSWQAIRGAGTQTNIANTWIWIKAGCQNGTAYLSYSFDGKSYTTAGTSQYNLSTARIYANSPLGKSDSSRGLGNGSIDLNETYFIVNGQPWFGNCPVEVKRHQIMGPVGYNVVGSPTIKDGIASGFSASNYLQLTQQFDITKDFECFFACKTGPADTILSYQRLWFYDCNGINGIWINNGVIYWWIATKDASHIISISTWQVTGEQDIIVRARHQNGTYDIAYSADNGQTWRTGGSQQFTHTGTTTIANTYLGNSTNYQNAWQGSIDLNHTYIKVNDELWFYQPQETKYIIRDDKLVWADPRLALSGPINYGIVGSPTIVDNIITQANNSNYVNISSADIPYTQYWEFATYVQLGVLTHYPYGISNANGNGKARWQIGTSTTKLRFIAAYDNGWMVDITGTTNFSANDWIYIKLNFTAATKTFTLYSSVDGVNWTNEGSGSSQSYEDGTGNVLSLMNDFHLYPAFLSMDLNKTYIKTEESLWFYGKNYATSNIAPVPAGYYTKGKVGCVAVGNPTIVDGVVNGFSQNDYLAINNSVNIKNITETMFKLYIDTSTITEDFLNFFLLQDGIRAQYYFNKNLDYGVNMKIYIAGAGHTSTSRNIPTDTWFYLKTTYDGTTYKAFKSLDKITWEELMSFDVDLSSETDSSSFRIGSNQTQVANYFRGSVDMNETYIKANNEMWFDGKGQCPFTGYVDMRTQTFTAAPSGATIGRNE